MSAVLPAPASTSPEQTQEHRRFVWLFAFVCLAGMHAFWATNGLIDQFYQSHCYVGGFRLLGSPTASYTEFFLHIDFILFLVGAIWLAHYRWTCQRPLVIEQESTCWTTGHRWGLASVMALGAGLLLWELGGPDLWQDEAQSALISRTVLQTGVPRGTDGLNYFSQEYGAEYAENHLWRWHTWLPFYIVAGSYELLGDNTFASRFPGALLGWISIWLTYQAAMELWKDRRSALCAAGMLTVCVAFLLLSRQCRYYSALMCFTLMSLIGYWRLMRSERGGYWLLISGMTLLFHTHYVYTAICGAAFIVDCAISHRPRWKPLAISASWVVVLALPWVIWFVQMKYGDRYGDRTFNVMESWEDLEEFMRQIAADMVPFLLWPIPLGLWYFRRKFGIRTADQSHVGAGVLLLVLVVMHVLMLAPIVPSAYTRYLAPILPLAAMLLGRWIADASRIHSAIAAWMVAVVVLSSPLADFVKEQMQPVISPGLAIREYLKAHSSPDDIIVASYGDLPLKYYLPNRIMGGLTGEDLSQVEAPEWIITRRYRHKAVDTRLMQWIWRGHYQQIEIPVPDTRFEFREEPRAHLFTTDWNDKNVIIFRRIDKPATVTQR